jgi:SET domain-containing protein
MRVWGKEKGRKSTVKIRVRVGPSRIAGQGLFAAQDIKKGTRILPYIGEKIPKDESTRRLAYGNNYIFELNDQYDIDGKTLENTARYINHSCAPNCDVTHTTRTIWIVALRDIKAGEELSYNYGYDIKDYLAHPCQCGASTCCGYILDQQYWGLIHLTEESLRGSDQSGDPEVKRESES